MAILDLENEMRFQATTMALVLTICAPLALAQPNDILSSSGYGPWLKLGQQQADTRSAAAQQIGVTQPVLDGTPNVVTAGGSADQTVAQKAPGQQAGQRPTYTRGTTVGANVRSVQPKCGAGLSIPFPDVCKTPSPGGPIPIPYPNTASANDTDGASNVARNRKAGLPAIGTGEHRITHGDEAAAQGDGVRSTAKQGKTEFVQYSMDVKFEGRNAARGLDRLLPNDRNTPPFPVRQAPIIRVPTNDAPCPLCGEDRN
ncbi:MAG: PAAR-like domain-containing protein [Pseudomonadota bacterium]